MRHQHVDEFIRDCRELIEGSPFVPWHQRLFKKDEAFFSRKIIGNLYRIKSPAIKAYLWLLITQEETARNTKAVFSISDSELARGLGVSRTTAKAYRDQLSGGSH